MTPLLKKFLGMNWLIFAAMSALAVFGVIVIYSVTQHRPDMMADSHKQATWIAIGVVIFFIVSFIDYRWIKWGAFPIYLASIIFLLLTRFMGHKAGGARSWLYLGPIHFQPAQLAVIGGILVLALFLSQYKNLHPMLRLVISGAIAAAPMLLILIQPDLGETIIWIPILLALWYIGGMPLRYLISVLLLGLAVIPVMVFFGLKNYQFDRLTVFLHPDSDPLGAGWAINGVLNAIGSGGWAGKGFMNPNMLVEQGRVPPTAVHTDYIFSSIGEQWGFIGGVALVIVYGLLIIACIYVALRASDDMGLLLCAGIIALIFTHVYQNIGMNVSIMPVTGVPLPLISYGGSFVVIVMFGLGLINSVWVHRKVLVE